LARVQQQIAATGESAQLLDILGMVHKARGEVAPAETSFIKAAAAQPKFADPLVQLGQLYAATGALDKAREKAESALKLEPNNVGAILTLASVKQAGGNAAGARADYERVLELDSTSVVAANNLALILVENGQDAGRALTLAGAAHAAAPDDPHVADTYGWVLFRVGNTEKALPLLRSSASRLSTSPSVQYHLGVAAAKAGDMGVAKQALTMAANSTIDVPERDAAKKALSTLR
jgi:Flp pilus assembly protein TadD